MSFGTKLKTARLRNKLTQIQLAEKSGISVRTIQNWERDERRPANIEVIEKMAAALEIPTTDLIEVEDQFIIAAQEKYGSRGKKDAKELVNDISALFAGGEMSDEDLDVFMRGITEAYWKIKESNKAKYTPKKNRK